MIMRHNKLLLFFVLSILTFSLILVSCGAGGNEPTNSEPGDDSNIEDDSVEVLYDLKTCYENNIESLLSRNNISQKDKNRYLNSKVFTKDELKNLSNIDPKDQKMYDALSSYSEDVQSIWIKNSATEATTQAETTYAFDPSMINSDNIENLKSHLKNQGVLEPTKDTHVVDNMLFLSLNQNDFELAGKLNRDGSGLIMDKNNEILFSAADVTGSVVIPNTVKRIQKEAFEGVENVTNVFIPNSVKVIEDDALVSLKDVNVFTNITKPEDDKLANELNKTDHRVVENLPEFDTTSWTKVSPVTNDEQGLSIRLDENGYKLETHSFKPLNGFKEKSFNNGKALNDKAVINECINAIKTGTSLSLTLTNNDGEIKGYSAANCDMFVNGDEISAQVFTKKSVYRIITDITSQFYSVEYDENTKFEKYPFKEFLVSENGDIYPILNDAAKNSVYKDGFFVGSVNIEQMTIDYKLKVEEYQVTIDVTQRIDKDSITSKITLYDLNDTFVVLPSDATLISDPHENAERPDIEYEAPETLLDADYSHGFKIAKEKLHEGMDPEHILSKIETIAPTKQTTNTSFYDINKENIGLQIENNIMNSYSFLLKVKECSTPGDEELLGIGNYVIEPNSLYFKKQCQFLENGIMEGVIIKTSDGNIVIDNINPRFKLPFSFRFPNEDHSYLKLLDDELNMIEILNEASKSLTKDNNHVIGTSDIPIYTSLHHKYPISVDYDVTFNTNSILMEYSINGGELVTQDSKHSFNFGRHYKIELLNLNSAKLYYSFDQVFNAPEDYQHEIEDRFSSEISFEINRTPDFVNKRILEIHSWKQQYGYSFEFFVLPTLDDSTFYELTNVVMPTCQTEGSATASFVLYGKKCSFDAILPPLPHNPDISKMGVCCGGISEDDTIEVLYSCTDCEDNVYVSLPALNDPRYVIEDTKGFCHEKKYIFYTIDLDGKIYKFYFENYPQRHDFIYELNYDPNDKEDYGSFTLKCKECGYVHKCSFYHLIRHLDHTTISKETCTQKEYVNYSGSLTINVEQEDYTFNVDFNGDYYQSDPYHIVRDYSLKPCAVNGVTMEKAGYAQQFCENKGCDLLYEEQYYIPALKNAEFYNHDNLRNVIQFRMGNYWDSEIIIELDEPAHVKYYAELADPNLMPEDILFDNVPSYYHLKNVVLNLNDNNGNSINDVYIDYMSLIDVIQEPTENQRGRGIYKASGIGWIEFELEIPALSEYNKEIPTTYIGKTFNNIFGYKRYMYDNRDYDELGNPTIVDFRELNDAYNLTGKSHKEILRYKDLIIYENVCETPKGESIINYYVEKNECYDNHDFEIVTRGPHNQYLQCKKCGDIFYGDDESTKVVEQPTCNSYGWGIYDYNGIKFETIVNRLPHKTKHYNNPEIGLQFDYCTECKNIYHIEWRKNITENDLGFNADPNNYIDTFYLPCMEQLIKNDFLLLGEYRFGPYFELKMGYRGYSGYIGDKRIEYIKSFKIMTEIGILYYSCELERIELIPYPDGIAFCEKDKYYLRDNNKEYNLFKEIYQDIKDKNCSLFDFRLITGKIMNGNEEIRYIISNEMITLCFKDRNKNYLYDTVYDVDFGLNT